MDINPYESPKAPAAPCAVTNGASVRGVRATFTAQTPEPHVVEIYFSRWTGLEVYRIDGVERLRRRSFALSDVQRFEIEGATPHVLEIATTAFPWPAGHASLHGRRIIDDLFPSERKVGMTMLVILFAL